MIPILYAKNASEFGNNGIGHLKDAISCKVTEERNGAYTLTLQYPIGGAWYESITEGSIIKAKANETSELQLFRVYKSSKPMKGVVAFYAEHISYDLKGLPLALLSMTDTTAEAALNAGFAACLLPHRFTGRSDITTLNKINITKPRSLRNFCGGEAGSVLSVWGGEFEFDNFTVWLHRRRGANNGVVIRYGKNLTDAKQERNISACYTHFCPYAIKKTKTRNEAGEVIESTEETITLPEGVIELINPENIGHSKAYTLDISDKFANGEEMNESNLRAHAEEYIESHKLGVPDVNITLSFMQIWHSPEYAESAGFERVALCDTVTVFFEDLGINAEAKVIKTEYDTLEERFSKIEVGDAKSNLTDTVSGIKESIEDTKKSLTESENAASAALQNAIIEATNKITGNSGGHVVLSPANNPQEILIMNTPDKETATRVWRWNSSGLGYSKSGYNGEYGLAMTMDGAIVADFITAGTLNAINITGCTITGGSLNINDRFTVDAEGNVRTEGEIIATSGIIGGCEIKDGKLVITSANITGQLTASQIDASELNVSAANITGKLTAAQINADGIEASNVNISGTFTATSGTFNGGLKTGSGTQYLQTKYDCLEIINGQWKGVFGPLGMYAFNSNYYGVSLLANATTYYVTLGCTNGGTLSGDWTLPASLAVDSDISLKNNIQEISMSYDTFFDKLKPVTYKYNNGTSDRTHTGFLATDVEEALGEAGIATQNFAGYVLSHEFDENGKEVDIRRLRYEEFISLNTWQIQKIKKRLSEVEAKINK